MSLENEPLDHLQFPSPTRTVPDPGKLPADEPDDPFDDSKDNSAEQIASPAPASLPALGKEAVRACKAVAIETAKLASRNAYVPYSHFPVGAAVVLKDGGILPGCNVENASFGLTHCAERTALFNAIAQGYRPQDIMGLALYTPTDTLTTPCGACRQVIAELIGPYGFVLCVCDQEQQEFLVGDLLPHTFTLTSSS